MTANFLSILIMAAVPWMNQSATGITAGAEFISGNGTTRQEAAENLRLRAVEILESHHHTSLGENSQLIDLDFLAGLGAITALNETHIESDIDESTWQATARFDPHRAKIQDLLVRSRTDLRQIHLKIAVELAFFLFINLWLHDRYHGWQMTQGFNVNRQFLWICLAGVAAVCIALHIFLHGGLLIYT
jgi:hypothetical protein